MKPSLRFIALIVAWAVLAGVSPAIWAQAPSAAQPKPRPTTEDEIAQQIEAAKDPRQRAALRMRLAHLRLKAGSVEKAHEEWRAVMADPDAGDLAATAFEQLRASFLRTGAYDRAVELHVLALRKADAAAEAWNEVERIRDLIAKPRHAATVAAALARARSEEAVSLGLQLAQAEAAYAAGDSAAVVALLRPILPRLAQDRRAPERLAEAARKSGNLAAGAEAAEALAALGTDPTDYEKAAQAWLAAGDAARAVSALRAMLAKTPKSSARFGAAAGLAAKARDHRAAAEWWTAAADVGAGLDAFDAREKAVESWRLAGDSARARQALGPLVASASDAPKRQRAFRNACQVAEETKDWTPASEAALRLGLGEPDEVRRSAMWQEAVELARKLGRDADVGPALSAAIQASPDDPAPRAILAARLAPGKDLNAQLAALRRMPPQSIELVTTVSDACRRAGDDATAAAVLGRAGLDPAKHAHAPLMAHLAEAYRATGQTDKGRAVLEQLVRAGQTEAALRAAATYKDADLTVDSLQRLATASRGADARYEWHLRLARACERQDRLDEAAAAFAKAWEARPDRRRDIALESATMLARRGQAEGVSNAVLPWLASADPTPAEATEHVALLVDAFRKAGKLDVLAERARQEIARAPRSGTLHLALVEALADIGGPAYLAALQAAHSALPEDTKVAERLAGRLHEGLRFAEAAEAFQASANGRALSRAQYQAWADSLVRSGRPDAAAGVASRLAFDLGDAEAQRAAAAIYLASGGFAEAIGCYLRSLGLTDPLDRMPRVAAWVRDEYEENRRLADGSARCGRYEAAVRALRRMTQLRPAETETYVRLGEAYARMQRPQEAAGVAREVLRRAGDGWTSHLAAGRILEAAGRLDDAASAYLNAVAKAPTVAERNVRRLHLAGIYVRLSKWASAEAQYKAVYSAATCPQEKEAAEKALKDLRDSTTQYDAVLLPYIERTYATGAQAYSTGQTLAQVCDNNKQFARAATLIQERLAKDPANGGLHVLMACVKGGEGDWTTAAKHLESALAAWPDDAVLLTQLPAAFERSGEIQKQVVAIRRMVEREPTVHRHRYSLATAYAQAGDEEKALAAAQEYVRMAPASHSVSFEMMQLYALLGRTDKAIDVMKEAIARHGSAPSSYMYHLALHLRSAGRLPEAREACLKMLAMPDCRGWYRAWAISQFTSMAETREGADAVIAELETNIARMEAAQERSAWSITLAVRYAVLGAVYESLDRTEEAILAFRRASELAPADPEHAANARRVQAGRDRVHQQVQAVLGDATILWKRRDPVTPARWWIGAQDTVLTLNADTAERTIWRGLLGHERFTPRGVAFDKDRVWLATDRGLFVHAREHQYWGLVPLPDAAQGSDVTEVRLKDPDRFVVKVRSEDGQEREIEGQRPGVRP